MTRPLSTFDKLRKVAKGSQKLFWIAVYLPQVHIDNGCGQGLEAGKSLAAIVGLNVPSFFNEFDPFFHEVPGYLSNAFMHNRALGETGEKYDSRLINFNLGFPSIQEAKKATTSNGFFATLAEKMSSEGSGNTASDASADKAGEDGHEILELIAVIAGGIFGGIIGAFGYLACIGEIDLFAFCRRSKWGGLEFPYRSRPNTPVFYMTYIV